MPKLRRVRFTPVLDDGNVYASGDILFVPTEVVGAVPYGKRVRIRYLKVTDKDDQKQAITFYFIRNNVTFGVINDPPSISDAEADDIASLVKLVADDYEDLGNVSIAVLQASAVPYQIMQPIANEVGTTSIWVAALCASGTPTYTASGLVVDFWVESEF